MSKSLPTGGQANDKGMSKVKRRHIDIWPFGILLNFEL
jgi:hypothetical protein